MAGFIWGKSPIAAWSSSNAIVADCFILLFTLKPLNIFIKSHHYFNTGRCSLTFGLLTYDVFIISLIFIDIFSEPKWIHFIRFRHDENFWNRLVNISIEKQTQVNLEMDGSVINHRRKYVCLTCTTGEPS